MIARNSYLLIRNILLWLILRPKKVAPQDLTIKSILAIRIDRVGDLVLSTPAIKALREYFPKAKIYVLVKKGNETLLKGSRFVDSVIVYNNFFDTLKLLHKYQFDLAIDLLMDYPIKPTFLAYFSRAKLRAGFSVIGKKRLFDISAKPRTTKKHISEYMLDLASSIIKFCLGKDVDFSQFEPEIFINGEEEKEMKRFLQEKGILEEDLLVGIHPGGYYPTQRWPIENFSQLADRLIEEFKVRIVIVGSFQEKTLVDKMISLMNHKSAIKAVGFSLDRLAALISLMDVFACNNSGPLHIAAAVNIPTVSTMGPTDQVLWRPRGKNHIVIRQNLFCSPCNRGICKNHNCMELIAVDDVVGAVKKQLESSVGKAKSEKYIPRRD